MGIAKDLSSPPSHFLIPISYFLIPISYFPLLPGTPYPSNHGKESPVGYVMFVILALVTGFVCGYFLYDAARRKGRSPILWGLLGFLFNVVALIAFRLIEGPIVEPH